MLIYTTITAYDTVNIFFSKDWSSNRNHRDSHFEFWLKNLLLLHKDQENKNFLESSKIRLNMHARANLSRKITVFSRQYLFYIWRLFTGSVHTSDKIYEFRYNYINILPHFQTVSRHVSGCMSYI